MEVVSGILVRSLGIRPSCWSLCIKASGFSDPRVGPSLWFPVIFVLRTGSSCGPRLGSSCGPPPNWHPREDPRVGPSTLYRKIFSNQTGRGPGTLVLVPRFGRGPPGPSWWTRDVLPQIFVRRPKNRNHNSLGCLNNLRSRRTFRERTHKSFTFSTMYVENGGY
jgi:hypothetical protein